jgi:hypothetical protein
VVRHRHAVERDDHVALEHAGFGGGTAGAHGQHAHAILALLRIDLDAEHGAVRPAGSEDANLAARVRAELSRQLRDFARGLVETFARFLELRARALLFRGVPLGVGRVPRRFRAIAFHARGLRVRHRRDRHRGQG